MDQPNEPLSSHVELTSNGPENPALLTHGETKKCWRHRFKLLHRFIERWHGRSRVYSRCDSPPTFDDVIKNKSKKFFWNRLFGPREFENKLLSLDMFICIPRHIRYYEWWKEHLKEKHERFTQLSSPPSAVTPQIVDGINVDLLREQYQRQIGLYEKYLDLLIKFNFFNFAITGAVLSFSLQSNERDIIRWSFTFPFVMNISFAILILLAFRSLKIINREIIYMSEFLGFLPPGVRTLRHALAVSFFTLLLLALMLSPTAFNVCDLKMYKVNVNWILSNRPSPTTPTYPCNTPEDDMAARQRAQEASPR